MIIERADQKDLEILLRLQKKCYQENGIRYQDENIPPLTQTMDEMHADYEKGIILTAVEEGEIIGSVRGYSVRDTVYIGRLFVDPLHQNKGVGKALMAEMERSYPKCTRFELFTGSLDEKNRGFYASLGYNRFKEVPFNDKITLIYFEKETCGMNVKGRRKRPCCR